MFNKILKESSIYSIEPILKKVILFFLLPLYTTYLTPEDFGKLEYIITISSFFVLIATGGFESSFFKYGYGEEENKRKIVLFNTLTSSLIVSFIILIFAYFIKDYLFQERIISLLFLLYLSARIIIILFNYNLLVLRYQHKAKSYLVIAIINFLFLISLNIFFIVYCELGFKGIIYANLISSVLSFLIFFKLLWNEITFSLDIDLIKKIFKFGLPMVPGNIAALIMTMSDRFFLERYSSSTELGLYSYGYKFGMLVNVLIITPFFMGWGPYKWQVYKTENAKEVYKKIFYYLSNGLVLAIVFFNIVLTFLGSTMTSNPEFIKGLSILPLILGSYYFIGITNFQALGVLFKDKSYLLSVALGIAAICNLILNYILIPKYGMIGASVATIISYLIHFIVYYYMNQRLYFIPFYKKDMFFNVFIVLFFSGMMLYLNMNYNKYCYSANAIFFLAIGFWFLMKFKKEALIIKKKLLKGR